MRLRINHCLPLAALIVLNGCIPSGGGHVSAVAPAANGPAADYPVAIGDPFTIDGVTYTPTDQLNYDAVGYASVAPQAGGGITASHKTLPLPSYVEVTSLESGRTILVRLQGRGPMSNDRLIELSPEAAVQLGFADGDRTPVRVRRVNPAEPERAMLRQGKQAPERMATPTPLLKVLKRKLAEHSPLAAKPAPTHPEASPAPAPAAPARPAVSQTPEPPRPAAVPAPKAAVSEPTHATAKPIAPAAAGNLVVQVAAFSTQARADAAASKLGAKVSKPGKYWYVRLGPYASQADASSGLAKARAAGYGDARIQRVN